MPNRWNDWFRQAQRDLEHAAASAEAGRHEWACFAAHQSAEKAVKALHLRIGQEAWGHVAAQLLVQLPASLAVPQALIERAQALDNFYIPARYPNAHPAGAPFEHYGPLQSRQAIEHAREILGFVAAQVA
jgi:HEPN domain-containing protein